MVGLGRIGRSDCGIDAADGSWEGLDRHLWGYYEDDGVLWTRTRLEGGLFSGLLIPNQLQKLQGLFLPNAASLVQLYDQVWFLLLIKFKINKLQLKVDQQFFEEAAECQLEEMRKWFASNTDMDGIKKKPEYIKVRS